MNRSAYLLALLPVGLFACEENKPVPVGHRTAPIASASAPAAATTVTIDKAQLANFAPLPKEMSSGENPTTAEKVELGRRLFYDKRLSKNHDVSCNSCHGLDNHGVDGKDFSVGHKGQKGGRNAPTVYNAAAQVAQFWDGRAANVEEQAKGPVLNPVEMAMPDEKRVLDTLKSIPQYVEAFKKAFPEADDPVTFDNMAKAIAAFERKLLTPSRWDAFLTGDSQALSEAEKEGFLKFSSTGCTACHNGAYVGGTTYQKLGAAKPWPNLEDEGRSAVTKEDKDKMMFKVPVLREIEHTGPYFHDSSAKTLDDAVAMMGRHQLGKELSPEDRQSIIAWLETLSGKVPAEYVKEPEPYPSTDKTPKPDPQ